MRHSAWIQWVKHGDATTYMETLSELLTLCEGNIHKPMDSTHEGPNGVEILCFICC